LKPGIGSRMHGMVGEVFAEFDFAHDRVRFLRQKLAAAILNFLRTRRLERERLVRAKQSPNSWAALPCSGIAGRMAVCKGRLDFCW
jgi:hypothetical protein